MDDCRTDAYRLSSASSTVSMTVLVVLSILFLSCGVDDLASGLVDVVSACLELCEDSKISSGYVRTSILKECSLCVFVRSAVRRDLAHNLPD